METFAEWIETQLKERDWRAADLARRAGIQDATLSRILSGARNAGPEVCTGIAVALDLLPEVVFRRAGLLPRRPPPVADEDELIHLYRQIKHTHRETVISALRGLVANGQHRPAPGSLPAQTAYEESASGNDAIHPDLEWFNRVSRVLSDEELRFFALRWARMAEVYENQIKAKNNAHVGERANAPADNHV